MNTTIDIQQAEIIVSEYGKLLSSIEPSIYGIPSSTLPYDKEQIKTAIQTLILAVDKDNKEIHDGLTQAYVYLAQFISDEQVKIAENGRAILESDSENSDERNPEDFELANQAIQIINSIKSEMESLMSEIRLLIP